MAHSKFSLGAVVATPGAIELMLRNLITPQSLLARHLAGGWGEVPREDARRNDEACRPEVEGRILSSYPVGDGRVWIITESDRSATTLLLPEEY